MNIKPIIMAGGEGSRLWPLSQSDLPKQFIKIIGNETLFQSTLRRNASIGKITVITHLDYQEIALTQAKEIGIDIDLILEPTRKNTAGCAILAALFAQELNAETVILIPSDLHITNTPQYILSLYQGALNTISSDKITLFGIGPTTPHTGYGYVEVGESYQNYVYKVEKFIEKPPLETAEAFYQSGCHFWNSGITIYKPEILLNIAHTHHSTTYDIVSQAYFNAQRQRDVIFIDRRYGDISPDSLDHAFLEKVSNLSMIKADFGWQDLGGWNSLWEIHDKDSIGNATRGNVALHDTSNSYISSEGKITAVIGVNDIIVVNTPTASLIAHKSRAGDVKLLLQELNGAKSKASVFEKQDNPFSKSVGEA